MTHILYGYKVEDGVIKIDEAKQKTLLKMFEQYLEGKSLNAISKLAGLDNTHSRIANMLTCERYLGDELYPKLIEENLYQKVQEARILRQKKHKIRQKVKLEYEYVLGNIIKNFSNPYEQAEYVYSLVERRVKI